MITEIGIVAGEIWNFLDTHGTVSLEELARGIERPQEWVLMSLGWLAREGHVLVDCKDDVYTIRLREKQKKQEVGNSTF